MCTLPLAVKLLYHPLASKWGWGCCLGAQVVTFLTGLQRKPYAEPLLNINIPFEFIKIFIVFMFSKLVGSGLRKEFVSYMHQITK